MVKALLDMVSRISTAVVIYTDYTYTEVSVKKCKPKLGEPSLGILINKNEAASNKRASPNFFCQLSPCPLLDLGVRAG